MRELFVLALAWAAGGAFGGVFFGGLWWTARLALPSAHPAPILVVSALLRMSMVLAGVYLVGRNHWERLALCLVGILMARVLVTWLTAPTKQSAIAAQGIANHAP